MSNGTNRRNVQVLFGLPEWLTLLDTSARALFGVSGEAFERSYVDGTMNTSGEAHDLASVIQLIQRLRERNKIDNES
jgi:hypothetical protein